MPKYLITIEATYEVEIPEMTEEVWKHIVDNYTAGDLPSGYEDADYEGGSISYEEVD